MVSCRSFFFFFALRNQVIFKIAQVFGAVCASERKTCAQYETGSKLKGMQSKVTSVLLPQISLPDGKPSL